MALLGIRTTLKQDIQCTPAELVYGMTLHIPGEFLCLTTDISTPDQTNYATKLKTAMQKLKAISPCQPKHQHINVSDLLHTCTHVFVQHDAIRKPLQAPYDGPYKVVTRNKKHFTVNIKGRKEVISVDRLKPAYLDLTITEAILTSNPPQPTSLISTLSPEPNRHHTTTRSGRQV